MDRRTQGACGTFLRSGEPLHALAVRSTRRALHFAKYKDSKRNTVRVVLRSIWIWTSILAILVVWLPVTALLRLFDRDPVHYRTGYWLRKAGHLATQLNPAWSISITGHEIDEPRRPYVVVCNHQSLADVPVICRLPMEMKWVIKTELFRLPFLGWMLRMAGDIRVDRADKKSRSRVLDVARDYLRKKCSVMFFPEGTRSRTGRVLRFTNGAFRLAIEEQVPVLPLVVEGTHDALPKHDWRFRAFSEIRLRVLSPVDTSGFTSDDVPVLREQVRRRILHQLADWRGEPPEQVDATAQSRPAGKDLVNTSSSSE